MKSAVSLSALVVMALAPLAVGQLNSRPIPSPLAGHPGNVFVAGETVVVPLSQPGAQGWRLFDYADRPVSEAQVVDGRADLGRLPAGFYRLQREGDSNWVSLAVLTPLKAATPAQSPVALDVAMAWFYRKERMDAVSSLCALAGVNWVRDRLAWGEVEPRSGQWAGSTRYDDSARAQAQAGLRVLQVNHSSPGWAAKNTKRFPPDLREAYRFYCEMARRWTNQVLAFEPWNEADIPMFGGHTGAEMAAMQKASYLGLKAGNPLVIACLNVFAVHNRAQLADLQDNEAWPYFDTFNLHHYAPFDDYPKLYADFRAVCAGRPLWVTECALPVKWSGSPTLQEPSLADSRLLSERVIKVFACSLHEGSVATYYFLLPHYVEGPTQFGLLRRDLTPRPGYLALAAVGRLLADARPLGRLRAVPESVRGYLFRAQPDGLSRDVLVAWTTRGQTNLPLPVPPAGVYDHLGRALETSERLSLSPAPLLAVLPQDSARRFSLQPPPEAPARLAGEASPVVLQALWPESKTVLAQSAYRISSRNPESVVLYAYNFGDAPARGTLKMTLPTGWQADPLEPLDLAPQSRTELRLGLKCPDDAATNKVATIGLSGEFGKAGRAVLSMRLIPEF